MPWARRCGGKRQTWLQFYGLRAAEVMGVFAEVIRRHRPHGAGDRHPDRRGWGWRSQILMRRWWWPKACAPPVDSFDAYAVTGYFSALAGVG
jgi:hypothetical protein